MFINDLFENKNVKEDWDEVKSRAGEIAKKTADTLVSAGAAAGDAVGAALNVIPRPFDEKTYQDRVSKPYPKTDRKAQDYKKMPESLDEENDPEIGSTVNVTTVKGRTYTGKLMRMDDNSIALRVYAAGGIPHTQDDAEPRSQIIVMKKDHVVSIDSELDEDLPPPENARKTQIASTLGTYKKAGAMFDKAGVQGKALDFGAGLGKGTAEIGKDAESYEPYPREDFNPNYIDATKIPSNSYSRIVNLNVLNVVPNVEGHRIRDEIVRQIGRVLAPGGMALITTRGRDVLTIKGTPGEEPMSMVSSIGTYQKGFTNSELKEYVQSVLGDDFEVSSAKLGPAGVMIKKHKESVDETAAKDRLHQRHQEIRKKAGRPHPNYYKELQATFDLPDDERWAKVAELKKKYNVEQIDELKDTTLKSYAQKARMSQSRAENMRAYSHSAPKGEYAGKTSREWESDIAKRKSGITKAKDKLTKPGIAEDSDNDMVRFSVETERAYQAVMDRFGDVIEWNGDDMMVPGKIWPSVEQVAFDADGIGAEQEYDNAQARDAFNSMFGGSNPASKLSIREQGVAEGAKPGWMLKQDPVLAKKVKDSKRGHESVKKWAGKSVPKQNKEQEVGEANEFNRMMGDITSSKSLNTREALELMSELIHQAGASYKEALQQASVSFEIEPAKLHELYQQQSSRIAEEEIPGLSPQMQQAKQQQQIMLSDIPPQDDNLNMLKAWAEYSPHRRIDYYVIAKFGNKGPNRNIFSNSVQKTLSAISNFPDMSGQELYDQFDLDQRDADRLYVAYENVADEFESLTEGNELNVGVEAYGVHGENNKKWRKTFKSQEAFEKWMDAHSEDVEVLGVREVNLNDMFKEESPALNVPKGWEAKTQPDGSTRISKQGSMSSADYKQNMANYKAQNWTPEKMADYGQRMASGQGYTDAERTANYQQQQKSFGQYADQPQLDEISKDTLKSYIPKRIEKTQGMARTDYNKAHRIVKKDIPRAMSKLKDPEYGKQVVDEDWSNKYKRSIDCSNPKGFSQKAHCAGRNKNEDINEDIERYVEALSRAGYEITEAATMCPECGGPAYEDKMLAEKQDACYHKVKSRYKVWPSAYASGALVRCRKAGAKNWGNKSKK